VGDVSTKQEYRQEDKDEVMKWRNKVKGELKKWKGVGRVTLLNAKGHSFIGLSEARVIKAITEIKE
jgi:hypothetical protein